VRIGREFTFDAAHFLPNHPGKCKNMHGHTYRVIVEIDGMPDPETGMVMDFGDLSNLVHRYLISRVDHETLNNVFEFLPTAENLAVKFVSILAEALPRDVRLASVRLYETPDSYAEAP
jgi:6-pyruvoyltetrahydropterin/6-carboxytetrahydropterin synthase